MNYWDVVAATAQVIEKHGMQLGKSQGMARYFEDTDLNENVAYMIQQAALDFLSTEFRGYPKEYVRRDLQGRTDELYDKWVAYAKKIYGINSVAGQQTGWEMIMGGQYGDPGLVDFPTNTKMEP